jgi:hypothetical protein
MLQTVLYGKPTKPDVDKIYPRLCQLKEGEIIEHKELEELLGISRNGQASRYRTILAVARRRLERETGVVLAAIQGVGLQYPTGHEQLGCGQRICRSGIRRVGRGARIIEHITDARLPVQQHREARDFALDRLKELRALAQKEQKVIALKIGIPEVSPQQRLPKE